MTTEQSLPFDRLLRYEANEMGQEEAIAMFQGWVDTGEIWQLPDEYLDTAAKLIEFGHLQTKDTRCLQ